MDEGKEFLCGLFAGALLASMLVGAIVHCCERDTWRLDAVRRGVAEYNAKTGDWQWKTPIPSESERE